MTVKIAIIGSGPSGMYAMDGINKYIPDCQIDIIDRLPTPYGLVRAGVAPDHLGIKNITNLFEKAIAKGDVKFFGNIEVGKDISINTLKDFYDAIIIATGAPIDRKLGIPGEDIAGVYGSAEFVGWYNGHPDHAHLAPNLSGKTAIIIGNGNVSLDISRILAKTPLERNASDINKEAAAALNASAFNNIHIVGRRGPLQTSFTPQELRELSKLDNATPNLDQRILSECDLISIDDTIPNGRIIKKIQKIFKSYNDIQKNPTKATIHLDFLASPVEIKGNGDVKNVRFEKNKLDGEIAVGTGEYFELEADIVITAIGYKSQAISHITFDDKNGRFPNIEGHIIDNIYVVGWGKRGPSGTIPTNRPDSFKVVKLMADKVNPSLKAGRLGLHDFLGNKDIHPTSFEDWKKLDNFEINQALPHKPREKILDIKEMLEIISQT